jgi:gamma-glutamylcyclotransferase (GGCT)/AIG2-like uncharacterized protein YtfP
MNKKIYIAYGSNLNIRQMKRRCPNANIIGKCILEDYKLEFRGVANIIKKKGEKVPIGLWEITEECEKALDIYEGYPKLYRKEYININVNGKEELGMAYVMNYKTIAPPSELYYNIIQQGYKDFQISNIALRKALIESIRYTKK